MTVRQILFTPGGSSVACLYAWSGSWDAVHNAPAANYLYAAPYGASWGMGSFHILREAWKFSGISDIPGDVVSIDQVLFRVKSYTNPTSEAYRLCLVTCDPSDPVVLTDYEHVNFGVDIIASWIAAWGAYTVVELPSVPLYLGIREKHDIEDYATGESHSYGNTSSSTSTGITTTLAASNVELYTATLNGTACWLYGKPCLLVKYTGGTEVATVYPQFRFRYMKHGTTDFQYTTWEDNLSPDENYSANIGSLEPGTRYHFRAAVLSYGDIVSFGDSFTFVTSGVAPTVTTQAVTDIRTITATGNGNNTNLGASYSDEIQLTNTQHGYIGYDYARVRAGQLLTITDRTVTKLAFLLAKYGSPSGDVTFEIRKVSDDSLICSKLWGDASDLTPYDDYEWCGVTFDSPVYINEQVRICVHYGGAGRVYFRRTGSVKSGENFVYQAIDGDWTNYYYNDMTYTYTHGDIVTQHGHCWNTIGNPTTADDKTENGKVAATGAFTSSMTSLIPRTKYYVRAYAINNVGTSYGSDRQFFTKRVIKGNPHIDQLIYQHVERM